MNLTEDSLDM
jgi:hypothetical protein